MAAEESTALLSCVLEGTCLNDADRLRELLGNAGVALFVLDRDARFEAVNQAWLDMHGYADQAEVLGKPLATALADDDFLQTLEGLAVSEDCSQPLRGAMDFRRADGGTGHALYVLCRLAGDGGRQHVEGLLVDISAQARAEDRLREANRLLEADVLRRTAEVQRHRGLLQTFLDNTHDSVFVHETSGRIIDVNDETLRLYGTTREEVLSRDLRDYMSKDNPVDDLSAYWESVLEGETRTFPWIAKRIDDGREFPVEVTLRRVARDGDDVILANVRDMSETRQAREQLELFGKVFESALEGITITDERGTILSVNPAFTTITGYEPREVIGQNPRILRSDHHDDAFYRAMWEALGAEGRWEGEIWNRRKSGEVYPEWLAISRLPGDGEARYIAVFHDITEMKHQERKLLHQAQHDPLTGLPNRLLLRDRLRVASLAASRAGRKVGVVFVDLDDFKKVNDALGHPVGDEILVDMAERLRGLTGNGDTLARLGSDEFVLMLGDLHDESEAARLAESIGRRMNRPFKARGQEVFLTASIGVAFYPDDGQEPEELLKCADLAMSRAKEVGKNTYALYTPQMHERVSRRIHLEGDIRQGMMRREFEPYYQAKIDARTGKVRGMEALIRWRRSDGSLVSPGEFIPLAEETGLIVPLGEMFTYEVARQMSELVRAGHEDLHVTVNVSPRQFQQEGLVPMLRSVLETTGLPPGCLGVEITETAIMGDIERTVEILNEIKDMGLSISIDDFGTGYSSLAYLKRFPINVLKIDQSFVRDLPGDEADASITATIIGMARNMNMCTVAEGVEDQAQATLLESLGCDSFQGFLYCRPLPFERFKTWLSEHE